MSLHAVLVPKWGLSMEEGKVVHWHIAEGQLVAPGDELVDIETTKITNTVEAQRGGRVRRLVGQLEETLPCGRIIAVLDDGDASDQAVEAFIAEYNSSAVEKARSALASIEQGFAGANGNRLHYARTGDGGTPVVLLHGFGGDLNNWLLIQDRLAEDRTVIAFDLPGHGASEKRNTHGDVDSLAKAVADALEELGVRKAHIVGHSLGGAIAIKLAEKLGGGAQSVALLAPAGLGKEINGSYICGFIEARRRRDLQGVLASLFADPKMASADLAEGLLRAKRLDGAEAALRTIGSANFPNGVQSLDLRSTLHALHIPVLVVWGALDRIIPVEHAAAIDSAVVLSDVGHMPHIEKAGEVQELIARHIEAADLGS